MRLVAVRLIKDRLFLCDSDSDVTRFDEPVQSNRVSVGRVFKMYKCMSLLYLIKSLNGWLLFYFIDYVCTVGTQAIDKT